jgi:hypothetical protein
VLKSNLPGWVYWLFGVAILLLAVDSVSIIFDTSTSFLERLALAGINFFLGFVLLSLLAVVLNWLAPGLTRFVQDVRR